MAGSRTRFVALLLAVLVIAGGCGGTQRTEGATTDSTNVRDDSTLEMPGGEQYGGHLVMAVNAETSGWDPNKNPWAQAAAYAGRTFIEPLGIVDDQGEAKPWLAEKWTHSDDFREWDITLNKGIMFSNGEELTAEVLKANFDDPAKQAKANGTQLSAAAANRLHQDVIDRYTMRVFLKDPAANYAAASTGWDIVATEMLSDPEAYWHPIGTGPFIFESWDRDHRLTAKRNPNYWRKGPQGQKLPYLDSIEFRPIVDEDVRMKALQSGAVNMIQSLSAATADQLDADNTVIRDFTSERTFIMLNTAESPQNAPNPFTNPHARRALAYAVDRRQLRDVLSRDAVHIPGSTPQGYAPGSKWAAPEGQEGYYPFDPDKAREEVAAYKRETGRDSLTFSLLSASSVDEVAMLQTVQAQFADVGITMNIDNQDVSSLIANVFFGKYQATGWRWFGLRNPDSNAGLLDSRNIRPIGTFSSNQTRFASPTIDENLRILREVPDFSARQKASWDIIREANHEALFIWMADAPHSLIADPTVHGLNAFRLNPIGNFAAKPWWGDVWMDQPK